MKPIINSIQYLLAITLICAWSGTQAQLSIGATDNQVNTTTTNNQNRPVAAQAGNGSSIIVWECTDKDGDGYGISAQRYSSPGVTSGGEIQINSSSTGNQRFPDVAMDDSGKHIAVWMDSEGNGTGWNISGSLFDATGATVASISDISSNSTGTHRMPKVAMDSDGDFVVAWMDNNTDSDAFGITARTFSSSGLSTSSNIAVNDSTVGYQGHPDVAMDASGNFVIVWQSAGYDGDGNGIFAKVYNSNGTVAVSEFQVNTTTSGNQQEPSVGMSSNGDFVVSWSSWDATNKVYQVMARRFDIAGTALSAETLVNGNTTEAHDHSDVAMTEEGQFIVTYSSYGPDGAYHGVYLQAFTGACVANGSQSLVNTATDLFQQFSGTAWRRDSLAALISWQSGALNTTSTQDGDQYGIISKIAVDVDTEAPIAICQDLTLSLDATGNVSLTAEQVDNGSSDNVGIDNLSLDQTSFDCNAAGNNTVTLTVTDAAGNATSCTAEITVEDNTAPTAVCNTATIQLDASGSATLTVGNVDGGSSDNCSISQSTISKESFLCTDAGTNNVTLTITDASGNSSNCTAQVTVEDNIAPTVTCANTTVQLDGTGTASITEGDVLGTISDNCGINSMSLNNSSFGCNDTGNNTVTLTVTDDNANSANCTATVTVQDNTDPVVTCNNLTVDLDGAGAVSITASQMEASSSDNCGISSSSVNISSFDCNDVGNNTVTLTVTDNSGNTATCNGTVLVRDEENPSITCPANENYSCVASIPTPNASEASATDNCDGNPLITVEDDENPSGSCINGDYLVVRTYTATDNNGNSSSCSQNITAAVPDKLVKGSCTFCLAKIKVFPDCEEPQKVRVTSCVKITKIQIRDANNATFVFNVSSKDKTVTAPSGLPINKVWAKSGCGPTSGGYTYSFNLCTETSKTEEPEMDIAFEDILHLEAFPNPTNGDLTVKLMNGVGGDGTFTIMVVDMKGQVLERRSVELEGGFIETEFDLKDYSAGLYNIIVDGAEDRLSKRVAKM